MAAVQPYVPERHAGRTIVVTGGSNGIGAAFVERMICESATVIICDIAEPGGASGAAPEARGTAQWIGCDLSDPSAIAGFAGQLRDQGIEPDALVHSAGIYPMQPVEEISYAMWRKLFSINVDSFFLLTQSLLPAMRRKGWGRIVGITSNTFQTGIANVSHYVATKGAMVGFMRSLSREVGPSGITVNGIAPTITRTKTIETVGQDHLLEPLSQQFQAIPKVAVPEDYTGTLSFLLSDEAAMITGQNLTVDGGWTHS